MTGRSTVMLSSATDTLEMLGRKVCDKRLVVGSCSVDRL